MTKSSEILHFPSLPLWKGVADSPGQYESLPFSLHLESNGLLRQRLSTDTQTRIISNYAKDEYSFITKPPGYSEWATSIGDKYVEFALSLLPEKDELCILEVGSGSTYIAEKLCANASIKRYLMVDPALSRESTRNPNIQIEADYFTGQDLGEFDIILSFNCLEHLPDPQSFLESLSKIKSSSKEPAIIGLVFPNVQNEILCSDFNMLLHEHISYFTPFSLANMLNELSLSLLTYRTTQCEFYIGIQCSNTRPQSKNSMHDYRDDINSFAVSLKEKLFYSVNKINERRSSSDRIAFHGATNGLNNILHLSNGLTSSTFSLFDGDSSKAGKFLPACSIPISSTNKYCPEDIDHIIITAMSYHRQIYEFLESELSIDSSKITAITSAQA